MRTTALIASAVIAVVAATKSATVEADDYLSTHLMDAQAEKTRLDVTGTNGSGSKYDQLKKLADIAVAEYAHKLAKAEERQARCHHATENAMKHLYQCTDALAAVVAGSLDHATVAWGTWERSRKSCHASYEESYLGLRQAGGDCAAHVPEDVPAPPTDDEVDPAPKDDVLPAPKDDDVAPPKDDDVYGDSNPPTGNVIDCGGQKIKLQFALSEEL
jgi:hypothetical protein